MTESELQEMLDHAVAGSTIHIAPAVLTLTKTLTIPAGVTLVCKPQSPPPTLGMSGVAVGVGGGSGGGLGRAS